LAPKEEAMNLYELSIPQLIRMLGRARSWLDKAQAYAEQKRFDPEVLLSARLAPDQWPLGRQYQAVLLGPQRIAALLRGMTPPQPEEWQPTIPELRARLDGVVERLAALNPEEFHGADDRVIPLPFLPGKGMKAPAWLTQFALPNFYFHVTIAYAILRHNGV